MRTLHIDDLQLGKATQAGHEVYLNAQYADSVPSKKNRQIIFKRNKYNKAHFSRMEVAFTQLARLFLSKNSTSAQQLVVDNSGAFVGLVSEHLCYVIAEKESLEPLFYKLTAPALGCAHAPVQVAIAEEIPLYFLDKVPQGFFARLLKAERDGDLTIDYASLASLLSGSYTLEEDDLHKGNFGFYLVEKKGKPEAVFFKIDHDLMFADSLMSFYSPRPQHLVRDKQAFAVTADDLQDFPKLHHSVNAYWPTKKSMFPLPWNNKEYRRDDEVHAFALLNTVPAFNKAKWLAFYKHILIPAELIELVLHECFDYDQPHDRAQIALMSQAVSARQAQLRAMLFALPEFQLCVRQLNKDEKAEISAELLSFCPEERRKEISGQLLHSFFFYEALCVESGFEEGDTPLHTAIKLGDFRYEETLSLFGHLVNVKNKAGKSPLDCALTLLTDAATQSDDARQDLRLMMKYLLDHGAEQSPAFQAFNCVEQIELYQFQSSYINQAKKTGAYQELKDVLRDIGEDHRYCLKFKKKLAVDCVKHYIENNKNNLYLSSSLRQLKKELNQDAPELKYIRQLRSNLWIIRKIRGLYGWTTTQSEINTLINDKTAANQSSCHASFFKKYAVDKMFVSVCANSCAC